MAARQIAAQEYHPGPRINLEPAIIAEARLLSRQDDERDAAATIEIWKNNGLTLFDICAVLRISAQSWRDVQTFIVMRLSI